MWKKTIFRTHIFIMSHKRCEFVAPTGINVQSEETLTERIKNSITLF